MPAGDNEGPKAIATSVKVVPKVPGPVPKWAGPGYQAKTDDPRADMALRAIGAATRASKAKAKLQEILGEKIPVNSLEAMDKAKKRKWIRRLVKILDRFYVSMKRNGLVAPA